MANNTDTDHQRRSLETRIVSDTESHVASQQQDAHHQSQDEGSLDAWFAIAGSFLVYFSSFGIINSFGYFQDLYISGFLRDYAASEIALIGTMQLALMYLTGPVVGSLYDAYGVKYLYPVGALGCCLSLITLSFTRPNHIWQQFLCQGLLFGLTVACGVQPALAVVAKLFKRRKALAMGLVASGSSAGGACYPIMFSRLVPRIGFAWSLRVGALISLVCYAVAWCITNTGHASKPLTSFRCLFDYSGFKDVRYACLALGSFLVNLGLYGPYYYAESFCALLDPTAQIKPYLLPLINASSLVGRIIGGHFADIIGRLNFLCPMTTLSGLLSLLMWRFSPNVNTLTAFVCLYGFCSGIFISVMPAATSQIVPDDKLGAQLGAFSSLVAIAVFAGTPIAGSLIKYDSVPGYTPLITYSGSAMLAGGVMLLIGRVLHGRNLREKW